MEKRNDAAKQPYEEHIERVDRAAETAGTTREKAAHELSVHEQWELSHRQRETHQSNAARQEAADFYSETNDNTRLRQDGYQETEGSGYGETNDKVAQPPQENPAQQGYDPAQSGPHQSKRQPGAKVPAPGRETGNAWAENEQMGYTTDTPDHGNPAN